MKIHEHLNEKGGDNYNDHIPASLSSHSLVVTLIGSLFPKPIKSGTSLS